MVPGDDERGRQVRPRLLTGLALVALAGGLAAQAAGAFAALAVSVAPHPSITADVHISFQPRGRLPRGGYYYAVLVLQGYPSGAAGEAPSCAVSSDMAKTQYGFPRRGHRLRLTILPASSAAGGWCSGGHYAGALYAVPHRPRCSYSSPCYGRSSQLVGPCWIVGEGRRVCGVVVRRPPYSYPGGLPRPIDASSRVLARFHVSF